MQAIAVGISKVFTSIGAAAGVGQAGAAVTGLGLVETGAKLGLGLMSARYQSQQMARMAKIEEENAARTRDAGRKDAAMQDEAAAAQIADDIARTGASGFATSSGSFVRRRGRLRELAARDRFRIVDDAELQAKSSMERAASYRAEGANARAGNLFSVLSAGIGIQKSLISGNNLVAEAAARRVNNSASFI